MIYESYPWKQDLLRYKRLLQKYNHTELLEKDDDRAYTVIEKSIFYSAFIIRKLIDCKCKVSDAVDSYSFRIEKIIPQKPITHLDRSIDNDTHDWEHISMVTIAGKEICNWLIHSVVFSLLVMEENVESFVVSSDYDRNKALYRIKIDDWIQYMDFVGTDYVVSLHSEYDEKIQDHKFTQKERG